MINKYIFRWSITAIRIIKDLVYGMCLRILEILGQIFPATAWGCKARGLFYKPFLKKCGCNFQVALLAKLECLDNIEVGDDVYIGHGSWVNGVRGGIVFGNEVMLGPFVQVISSNHRFNNGSARFAAGKGRPIVINNGTWIAGGVHVLAGVTVGHSCLLAAGAVVTKDVPDCSVVAGVPARIIGSTLEHPERD